MLNNKNIIIEKKKQRKTDKGNIFVTIEKDAYKKQKLSFQIVQNLKDSTSKKKKN